MKNIKRGQVWEIDLTPTKGAEMEKVRPCVVVSSDTLGVLPLRLVVPITEWNEGFSNHVWHVKIKPNLQNGLQKESSADAFQARSVSIERFITLKGSVSKDQLDDIVSAIGLVIEIV
jgi:mRNA interferase MazF